MSDVTTGEPFTNFKIEDDCPATDEAKAEAKLAFIEAEELIRQLQNDAEAAERYSANLDNLISLLEFELPRLLGHKTVVVQRTFGQYHELCSYMTYDGEHLSEDNSIFTLGSVAKFWVPSSYQNC